MCTEQSSGPLLASASQPPIRPGMFSHWEGGFKNPKFSQPPQCNFHIELIIFSELYDPKECAATSVGAARSMQAVFPFAGAQADYLYKQ